MKLAKIDRRVRINGNAAGTQFETVRASSLRDAPFVVWLGEPGAGKSGLLKQEAIVAGTVVVTAADLLGGAGASGDGVLFVDGLDEYRSEGEPKSKTRSLAQALKERSPHSWRVTCRSEDWKKDADLHVLRSVAGDTDIVVAELLPLDLDEQRAVLRSFGDIDSDAEADKLLQRLNQTGAGFLGGTPLGLRLVNEAAGAGELPDNRFDLFDIAIARLLEEHNETRAYDDDRPAQVELRATAARICLTMLLSGASGAWRPGGPLRRQQRPLVTREAAGLDVRPFRATLDTALFSGDGAVFMPLHRTVVEYLGGEALARAVKGESGKGALTLARARATLMDQGDAPPTELRGLFAWFAAWLFRLGLTSEAEKLIRCDPAAALLYGDAAVFPKHARVELFNLYVSDPGALSARWETGAAALGALVRPDMVDVLKAALLCADGDQSRLATALMVLRSGPALPTMSDPLRALALSHAYQGWRRQEAAEILIRDAADPASLRRELFDAIANEAPSAARETLRVFLAAGMVGNGLSAGELRSVLRDIRNAADIDHSGLIPLRRALERMPMLELFDESLADWMPRGSSRSLGIQIRNRIQVERLLEAALATAISSDPPVKGDRIWNWLRHAGRTLERENCRRALQAWIDGGREIELLSEIIRTRAPNDDAFFVRDIYVDTTNRDLSKGALKELLNRSQSEGELAEQRFMLEVAIEFAAGMHVPCCMYWRVYNIVASQPKQSDLLSRLTFAPIARWRVRQANERAAYAAEIERVRSENVLRLSRRLHQIESGQSIDDLVCGAEAYLDEDPRGIEAINALADENIADAIRHGWLRYLLNTANLPSPAEVADADVRNDIPWTHAIPTVAVDDLLKRGEVAALDGAEPMVWILAWLNAYRLSAPEDQTALKTWALDKLSAEGERGASALVATWMAAIDAGLTHISTLWDISQPEAPKDLAASALRLLLQNPERLHGHVLTAALEGAARHLDREELAEIARGAVAHGNLAPKSASLWSLLQYLLDPVAGVPAGDDAEMVNAMASDCFKTLRALLTCEDPSENTLIDAEIIQRLGPSAGPGRQGNSRGITVHSALNRLADSEDAGAGSTLGKLLDHPTLSDWHFSIKMARSQHLRKMRDQAFKHPTAADVRDALSGGPPINSGDLRAVVVDAIQRLSVELHSGDTGWWKAFWNIDQHGRAESPRIENDNRDRLLERLKDKLAPFGVAASLPEAQRGDGTRADTLVISSAGRTLPIEAKRHFHPDLWKTARSQLQGYAAAPDGDGDGILLVFWFGTEEGQTPPRGNGDKRRPTSASELQEMLEEDLAGELGGVTDVVVLDVSRPAKN